MEKVQPTPPMRSIHEGEECLQQAIDLLKKADDLKENQ